MRLARIQVKRARDRRLLYTIVAGVVAIALVNTGVVQLPFIRQALTYPPVVVLGEPVLPPALVRALPAFLRPAPRAAPGAVVRVSLTQYCLRGETRRGRQVRPGIVAADPKVFPLARYVEVFMGDRYLGRFLVDDTGKNIIGNTLDIWTPNCREARRFGRQWGHAVLVTRQAVSRNP